MTRRETKAGQGDIREVQAIDVHAHLGQYEGAKNELLGRLYSGDEEMVTARARAANTRVTIVSALEALLPRGKADAVRGNAAAFPVVCRTNGLLMWPVVNPLQAESYDQAAEMLRSPKCPGIKIHPEEHVYPIVQHGRRVFEFAARQRTLVATHSGEQNSLPADFVALANDFPEVTLILGHLGCGWDSDPTHQVRALQAARHGNVYVDVSSGMNVTAGLLEWAVGQVGSDRLLYGTDSPLYFAPMQRARVDKAEMADEHKRKILFENAERLLGAARLAAAG